MASDPDPEVAVRIVEEIMTMHWSPAGCKCWVCREGKRGGMRARSRYMRHLRTQPERGYVHVDRTVNSPAVRGFLSGNGGEDI